MTRTNKPGFDRIIALVLSLMIAMTLMLHTTLPAMAEGGTPTDEIVEETDVPTAEPDPTEVPMESTSPYKVVFTVPSGWTGENSADVTVSVNYLSGLAVSKAEYKLDGGWIDMTDQLNGGKATISVSDNGTLTLRLMDPHGHAFKETVEISCFDRTAPVVTAKIDSDELQVHAQDSQSGVAGIQVNGLLFTTMSDGTLTITMTDTMNKYERLAVRAFDYAGNFSEPVTLDNPYYEPEATPTPIPTATPKTTSSTSGTTAEATAAASATPAATATQSTGSSLIYVFTGDTTATATPAAVVDEPVATPTPQVIYETVTETEYITIGPGMPYQADGNSHTLDVLYSAATNKQFITLQTKSGNTFYLVIDYDKPIDEDAEMYETYFLNLVDERDLLALMSDEEQEEVPTATPQIVYVTPEPTTVPAATVAPTETDTGKTDQSTAILALVAILGIGGVAAYFFVKNKKSGTQRKPAIDYEFDDVEDDEQEQEQGQNT